MSLDAFPDRPHVCTECAKAGLKSQTRCCNQGAYMGDNRSDAWWDEEGVYHRHEYVESVTKWWCSNGHRWREVRYLRCQCGWQRLPDLVESVTEGEFQRDYVERR